MPIFWRLDAIWGSRPNARIITSSDSMAASVPLNAPTTDLPNAPPNDPPNDYEWPCG